MKGEIPDWVRLQKALSVEAEKGYPDLQGNQYRFSEFLCLSFGDNPPVGIATSERNRWRELAQKFAQYSQFNPRQRQQLVAETRNFLQQLRQTLEATPTPKEPAAAKIINTTPITAKANSPRQVTLEQPLKYLAEVGERKASLLERLNLHKVEDLLYYYPRDHVDYSRQVNIANLTEGETVTLVGNVKRCNCFTSPKNTKLAIFELLLQDRTGQIKLNRFYAGTRYTNRAWQEGQKKLYLVGSVVAVSGLVKAGKYGLTLENPEFELLDSSGASIESLNIGRILPVYPLTDGVPADLIRKAVVAAFGAVEAIKDPLPFGLRKQYGLIDLKTAITNIHFPNNAEILSQARRRLVFDEFFFLQLGFLRRRQQYRQTQKSAVFSAKGQLIDRFNQIIPFQLTNAQKRVIEEILEDLDSSTPMNRLVQGDVGSGKTIVGVYAILAALQSGYQAALMAPTEVLAEQHYRKLVSWFNLLHLPVELLTGSTKTAKRREIHAQLETGELPLLVGTHALIQDAVNFRKLGLVVIDEQHRFGVQQRARLLSKGESPHVLTMTATPIPRTLALTLHGDLDVSQIDELPPGRQPIQTTALNGNQRRAAYDLIRREIAQGRQAYVIFPLIEESEKLDVRAAVEEYQNLSEKIFPNFNIGLLHGRMSSAEKEEILTAFRDNILQIIVSTTVIEVGVDVPNATVMLIENAERFGLSQLHQLRGRVGRGSHQSYCLLLSGTNSANSRQRLTVLEQSQDGFFISEMDMRFRGPGEVLGQRQSGLPDFALASLVEDQEVLVLARDAAEKIMLDDPHLITLPNLKQALEAKYQRMLGADILT
ncbi:MAG: ATP-dependent DNA helicase RecG [Microcystis sp. M015S2]|uniref:ATP-dependent DNA helicase RecG n=1 Tax=unclassified Microcystis TaxID=2643300 RepID=UPI0025876CF7|nr:MULTISPECIES: ATP-dependent DNA helicase RecG [unclassified Microcystis]MCA2711634.1 ATP-dependent DNA helicase RecG [Microcystis sp. M025S2]MCA2744740.1 ATP-dependent DNA helicase RecG [Microcystis sp. M015S2]MCA2758897.1 ATP-dependent DNA helicase RecG [Microcystis sp. M145S2]